MHQNVLLQKMQNYMYAFRHYIDALYQAFIYRSFDTPIATKKTLLSPSSNSLKRHKLFANGTELQNQPKRNHKVT